MWACLSSLLWRRLERIFNRSAAGILAATVVGLLGAVLLHSNERVGKATRTFSYNFLFSSYGIVSELTGKSAAAGNNDLILLYLDEASHREFNWPEDRPWNRATHAALVDRLREDGARLVIFDIVFAGAGPDPAADLAFAQAIARSGRVVLAAEPPSQEYQVDHGSRVRLTTVQGPYESFAAAAAGWGIAALDRDEDWVVREHWHASTEHDGKSLAWVAAEALALPVARSEAGPMAERWINYYDRPGAVPGRSYKDAFSSDLPRGYFSNKVVMVGARSMVLKFGERRDEYRTPYTTWFKQPVFYPGVDVHGHMLLNLMRGDWLRRPAPVVEWLGLAVVAVLAGWGLLQLRARTAFLAAGLGLVAGCLLVFFLFALGRVWFPWLVAVAQLGAALALSFFYNSLEWWRQERALQAARQAGELRIREQAALLDAARDAIFVCDLAGRVTYWNASAERLYGWPRAAALGALAWVVTGEAAAAGGDGGAASRLEAAWSGLLAAGAWSSRVRQSTRAGGALVVDCRCTRVCDEATGQPKGVLVINTDVTERQQLETQLLRAQRMESIGTLAGGIAHDLNNVLSPVLMATQLLQMKARDESEQKFLSTIEVSAKRAADMVKQVLAFARGQEGDRVVLQLKHIVRDMEKIMRETFPRSIALEIYIAPDLPTVLGDATQLHQVILNLCVNARDAMPGGGHLSIRAEVRQLGEAEAARYHGARAGAYVALTVADTGTGMPPEVMERIYEPFFTTKEPGKGTGLGLSTTLTIVRTHGGVIDVASTVGRGTTFTVLLPAAEAAVVAAESPAAAAVAAGGGRMVLVVDDEPLIGIMTESILSMHGYEVLLAENGEQGVALFRQHAWNIEVVLCDMMMPVMDGPEAIQQMREVRPDVPVIVMSGLMQVSEMERVAEGPPPGSLGKPFTAEALLRAVEAMTAARSEGAAGPGAPPRPELAGSAGELALA